MNVVCFFILLARELENELDLSLYSLSSKTSRYAHFGDNQLTVYGLPVSRLMLPLQPKFEFLNIRYATCEIQIAAFEIRIAVYVPEAYCPKYGLSLVNYGQSLATVNYFLKLQVDPKVL